MALTIKNVDWPPSALEEMRLAQQRAMKEMLSPSLQESLRDAFPTAKSIIRDIERQQRQQLLDSVGLGSISNYARQFEAMGLRSAMESAESEYRRQLESISPSAEVLKAIAGAALGNIAAFEQVMGGTSPTVDALVGLDFGRIEAAHTNALSAMRETERVLQLAAGTPSFATLEEEMSRFSVPNLELSALTRAVPEILAESFAQREIAKALTFGERHLEEVLAQVNATSMVDRLLDQVRGWEASSISSWADAQNLLKTIDWDDVLDDDVEISEHSSETPAAESSTPKRKAKKPRRRKLTMKQLAAIAVLMQALVLLFGDNWIPRLHEYLKGPWESLDQSAAPANDASKSVPDDLPAPSVEPPAVEPFQPLQASLSMDRPTQIVEPRSTHFALPSLIADAGDAASRRYVAFFTASIRNKNTRSAYAHACGQFLFMCADGGLTLHQVEPIHVAAYVESLAQTHSAASVKQHLAAIRRMFDYLVVGQIVPASPAASVRGPKHVVSEGKTPTLDADETRHLFAKFDATQLSDLRDRALIGTMVYSFARVGALVKLRVRDYYRQGAKAWFMLDEKGGKQNRVPVHHLAAEYVESYIASAGIESQRDTPLFRSFGRGRGSTDVSNRGLSRGEIFAIVQRRVQAAGLPKEIGCHSFRGTGITNYLSNGGTIETAAKLAGHSSTRTTQLYDRRHAEVALAEIERIRF